LLGVGRGVVCGVPLDTHDPFGGAVFNRLDHTITAVRYDLLVGCDPIN